MARFDVQLQFHVLGLLDPSCFVCMYLEYCKLCFFHDMSSNRRYRTFLVYACVSRARVPRQFINRIGMYRCE